MCDLLVSLKNVDGKTIKVLIDFLLTPVYPNKKRTENMSINRRICDTLKKPNTCLRVMRLNK